MDQDSGAVTFQFLAPMVKSNTNQFLPTQLLTFSSVRIGFIVAASDSMGTGLVKIDVPLANFSTTGPLVADTLHVDTLLTFR